MDKYFFPLNQMDRCGCDGLVGRDGADPFGSQEIVKMAMRGS